MAAPGIQQRGPADADQVPGLRQAATAFAAGFCDRETPAAVALAVTEACANVVCHAYPDGDGELDLRGWLDGGFVVFVIADQGSGLTGVSRHKGLGMGLALMHRLGDARITSDGHGTCVELRFPRSSP